jgi:hypothetical protein
MRENYPDFLCMKCNAHIYYLYFKTSNPGILQSSSGCGSSKQKQVGVDALSTRRHVAERCSAVVIAKARQR